MVESPKELGRLEFKVVGTNASLYLTKNFHLPTVSCQTEGWLNCGSAIILDMNGTVEWPSTTSISFKLSGIRNRPFSGPPATFRILTMDFENHVTDLNSTMQLHILPNHIRSITARLGSDLTNLVMGSRSLFCLPILYHRNVIFT